MQTMHYIVEDSYSIVWHDARMHGAMMMSLFAALVSNCVGKNLILSKYSPQSSHRITINVALCTAVHLTIRVGA